MRRWFACVARFVLGPAIGEGLTGVAAGMCLATLGLQLLLLWGASPTVSLALCAALGIGLAAGCGAAKSAPPSAVISEGVSRFGLVTCVAASPWLLERLDQIMRDRAIFNPAHSGANSLWVLVIALVYLGLPAGFTARLATLAVRRARSASTVPLMLSGAALGIGVWGVWLAQIAGPYLCGVAAGLLGLVPFVWRLVRPPVLAAGIQPPADDAESLRSSLRAHGGGGIVSELFRFAALGLECALAAGIGGLFAALVRVLEQLMADTVFIACVEAVSVLAGVALGLALAPRLTRAAGSVHRLRLWACLGVGLFAAAVLAAFPWLIHLALWQNATIASPTLLVLARGSLALLLLLPPGAALGLCLARCGTGAETAADLRSLLVCLIPGVFVILPLAERGVTADLAVIGAAWWVVGFGVLQWLAARDASVGWSQHVVAATVLLIVLAAPVWRARLAPALAARVLFSTSSFVAWQAGFDARLLPYLDEGRLVGSAEGACSLTSVWKFGGNQLQLRENGVPQGLVSCDPEVFPRSLSETLPAALPLALHEAPRSLLLLGLGTGEALSAVLSFPVPEVVCWEADAARVRALREIIAPETGIDPLEDDRVRLVICDPALALDAQPSSFDAIVSLPGHASLLRAQSSFTLEFYRRVARRLAADGVFCQRLSTVDLGPRSVSAVVRTLQAVFGDVLMIEAGPGELLLAATNAPEGLLRPKLMDRLQKPHVREVLAQSGVDWSVILNVSACRHDGLTEFCGAVKRANSAFDGRLPFAFARDVMRWGPKQQELHAELAPYSGRLAAWIGADGESPVLVRRLAEVTGQQELLAKCNDQYWAYRASLRTQLTQKPRSQIQQVAATSERRETHPEDRRRIQYFQALGRAVKTKAPADIDQLASFAAPYDPLVTYFVHLEAGELYARSAERDAAQELRHRLHGTWFSSPRDASLPNVVATLKLLRERPEAEPDALRRFDQLNAALQALQQRWEARQGIRPRDVKAAIDDIDTTILTAEASFDLLDKLAPEAGIAADAWAARRAVLERTLVRPVKAYRSELLPHLHRRKKASAAESEDAPPSSSSSAAAEVEAVAPAELPAVVPAAGETSAPN
ncbi:MAG: hypothetical protein ACT4QC_16240 [Planctomycetaceae bacterium]